jgi:hypothetical protein
VNGTISEHSSSRDIGREDLDAERMQSCQEGYIQLLAEGVTEPQPAARR